MRDKPSASARYFKISTASLSVLGHKHDLSRPVIQLLERYTSFGSLDQERSFETKADRQKKE